MAEITAKMVSQLREETGAGMMDCKKALTDAGGDMEEARLILRRKGQATAEKRGERQASEGVVAAHISQSGSVGVLLELNCETDFVARNDDFRALAHELAQQVANAEKPDSYPTIDALLAARSTTEGAENKTVNELVTETIGRIGEKIVVSRFTRMDASPERGAVGSYIHRTDFKTGVLVEVRAEGQPKSLDPLATLANEIAIHVAAARPTYLSRDEVPEDIIQRERELAQAKADADPSFANKPEAARNAMIEGQIRKYLEQTVLLDQGFVRDPSGKQKVSALVEATAKEAGVPVKVVRFARYRVGESGGQA
jgi:elongation factor Ts